MNSLKECSEINHKHPDAVLARKIKRLNKQYHRKTKSPNQDWPKNEELERRFGASFKKEFVDYLKNKYDGTDFDPYELNDDIASFNFDSIIDIENEFSIRAVNSRLGIGESIGGFYFDVRPFEYPSYMKTDYQVINPGMGLIEINNSQGHSAFITVKFELAFPF